jgi:hypothetical protein
MPTTDDRYEKMTQGDFNRHLEQILAGKSAKEILLIPGVYEILAEHFNNEVLDRWDAEQEAAAAATEGQRFFPGEHVLYVHEGPGCYPDTPCKIIEKMVDKPQTCPVCGQKWDGFDGPDHYKKNPSYYIQYPSGACGIISVSRLRKMEG